MSNLEKNNLLFHPNERSIHIDRPYQSFFLSLIIAGQEDNYIRCLRKLITRF
jgi:hypothetical protein